MCRQDSSSIMQAGCPPHGDHSHGLQPSLNPAASHTKWTPTRLIAPPDQNTIQVVNQLRLQVTLALAHSLGFKDFRCCRILGEGLGASPC